MSAKKHSGNKDIALSYRFDVLPGPVRKSEVFSRLIGYIRDGTELPDNWLVTLRWRNSPKQDWREDEFQTAISESREGFLKVVLVRLLRDREGVPKIEPPKKKKTKRKKRKPTRRTRKSLHAHAKHRKRTAGPCAKKVRRGKTHTKKRH